MTEGGSVKRRAKMERLYILNNPRYNGGEKEGVAMAEEMERERRTLGTTAGGSTYMLTLPRPWVERLGWAKGDPLTLVWMGEGIYLGAEREAEASRVRLEISPFTGKPLERAIISLYVAGFDVIELFGKISVEQREVVRRTTQRLIGPEILQEAAERILIHTLRDPTVLAVDQILEHLWENSQAMFSDGLRALLEHDLESARGVRQRDDDVDRFFLLLSRQFYLALRDPLAEVSASKVEFFNAHTVARQLERIADHAAKLAAVTEEIERVPKVILPLLKEVGMKTSQELSQAFQAFLTHDSGAANRVLDESQSIEEALLEINKKLLSRPDPRSAPLRIVTDSIGRVKDYANNIAEVALNAGALRYPSGPQG
jgi:phosphate uptake regulator